ncbi:hypothetical protein SAMN05216361_1421 [Marisediminitalea aggregata]|uniref:Uncharacterized protein n=1 Tax=Marisediminitalea aggregata TaxID=634436 RepID=A0A1M5HD54_9ALTE|nr:hypothetical protein SAMN05216361_1421 [Marisediminitalea aggregata]
MQPKVPGQARDDVSLIHHPSSRNRPSDIRDLRNRSAEGVLFLNLGLFE